MLRTAACIQSFVKYNKRLRVRNSPVSLTYGLEVSHIHELLGIAQALANSKAE